MSSPRPERVPTTAPTPGIDAGAVLAWGLPRLRDLPWRHTRDPWQVLVAEVMLQQTQAGRVVPAWRAFLDAFPTPADCAAASLGDVLRRWQGLGYPRRGRNLRAAAATIVEHHHGRVPDSLDALLALPGVGRYTARAVLAFAFERDVAVVDTNIARVLARCAGTRLTATAVQAAADELVPGDAGWLWNQTLMDLGATVCRPEPACLRCPIAAGCAWATAGRPDPDPAHGSAAVSRRQAPFAGSDREARGHLLRALTERALVTRGELVDVMRRSQAHAERLAAALVDEGLVAAAPGGFALPDQLRRPDGLSR